MTVAAITFTFAMAVAGGVIFGHAVTSDDEKALDGAGLDASQAVSAATPKKSESKAEPWPAGGAEEAAQEIAKSRTGTVSFAAVGPDGTTVDFEPGRQFYSASVSKAMLLVAELRRLKREGLPLDEATRSTLEQMITVSDNDAANLIYQRVGDPGLNEVAELSAMTGFEGDVGHWSNVKITAGDMALFMSKLDELLDLPHGDEGSRLLASVISSQAWGIPQVAPKGAGVRFQGGWRPADSGQLVHQAARIDIGGDSYSIAVLTDGNPDQAYGQETIRLVAAELLRGADAPE